ncbi:MAG: 6-bladed beta-propeller [Gemmatimonadota bacterium]|nr:6-bladed beta-propeller [Gemmatimonadota bacterium]
MRIACILLSALGMGHVTAMRLGAQEPEVVSGEVTCGECVITLDTVVTIGGLDGPGLELVSPFSHVAVDRRGRILLWNSREAEVAVFDSTGTYLRTIGGRGEGPGEYQSISHIGVGPHYIHVFEYHKGRTMLDHDFQVLRTDRFLGEVRSAAVVSDDVAVFLTSVPTPGSVDHKFHVLRPSGEMASRGYDGRVHSPEQTPRATHTAVAGRDETVWAVPWETNRIVRWDLTPEPRIRRVYDRRVAEFDEGDDEFAPAALGSAMLDDRGLWLVWHTADPDWTGPPPPPEARLHEIDIVELRDGWLDLVDPATGRTLARYHHDGVFVGFDGSSRYVIGYEETEAGVPFLHILEPRLSRR